MPDDNEPVLLTGRFNTARVLCIGDVMLDHFLYGTMGTDAAEAVLRIESERRQVGGAGDVLRHLALLGAAAAFVSVVGNDDAGREIERLLAADSDAEIHLLVQPERQTTVKSRFIADDRRLLRADRSGTASLGPYIREDLLRLARELVIGRGAVIVSDHAEGVLNDGVALEIIRAAQEAGARVVVDPAGGDPIRYRGADLLIASRRELAEATGMPVGGRRAIEAATRALINRCAFGAVLVAAGAAEMTLIAADGAVCAEPRATRTRADEAVVATVAAALGAGLPLAAAMRLASVGESEPELA